MKQEIKYIELKSGHSDNGPAWIGLVSFSKSGKTIYFNGKAFKSGNGISGNYYDTESGEEYWISGVKKDMNDRHWAGGGIIGVEKSIVDDYLKLIGRKTLHPKKHTITEVITEIPLERLHQMENREADSEPFSNDILFKNAAELTVEELQWGTQVLYMDEMNTKHNKARRLFKHIRLEFESEIEKRKVNT